MCLRVTMMSLIVCSFVIISAFFTFVLQYIYIICHILPLIVPLQKFSLFNQIELKFRFLSLTIEVTP